MIVNKSKWAKEKKIKKEKVPNVGIKTRILQKIMKKKDKKDQDI